MRGLVLTVTVLLQLAPGLAQCASKSINQCALDCTCQRVACCCGTDCQLDSSGKVVYNKCVEAGTSALTWGCPGFNDCPTGSPPISAVIQDCSPSTPTAPTMATGPIDPSSNIPGFQFGTSFPMLGTQPVPKQTWHQNIFMGTKLQFNQGAFWGYTDSFYVPHTTYVVAGNNNNYLQPTPQPTPATVSYEGQLCYAYITGYMCPAGYYCQVSPGYQPLQQGVCKKQNTIGGNNGNWNNGNWNNNGWNNNGWNNGNSGGTVITPQPTVGNWNTGGWNNNAGNSGNNWFTTTPTSCGPPSVCGYKSVNSACWCDSKCKETGDCCGDVETYCSVNSAPNPTPAPVINPATSYVPPTCTNPYLAGDCLTRCNDPNPVYHQQGKCYCDDTCLNYGDCCCNKDAVCL